MLDLLQWRILKRGMAPGTLVYSGQEHSFPPVLCEYVYDRTGLEEHCLDQEIHRQTDSGKTRLLHLTGIHDAQVMGRVGQALDMHPLIVEDIMNTGQRPKFQSEGEGVFMVFKDIDLHGDFDRPRQHQLGIYWHADTVMAFQEHDQEPWKGVLERLGQGRGRIRSSGPSYLVVALVDALIDKYYQTLGELNERAEALEEEFSVRQTESALMQLYGLKRELVLFRSTFLAARDNLEKLSKQEICPITEENRPFLADVRDHAQQVVDTSTALHDILSDMLNVQISLAGMRMNSVMKVLTVIATIFIPLTFLSGIYGMNFTNMPELQWEYGYPVLWGVMVCLFAGMVWFFRRRDWF